MCKTYVGIDLHSNNCYFAAINPEGKKLFHKRVPNKLSSIDSVLKQIEKHGEIVTLAVESTYNWYWLVDHLQDLNYDIRLANPGMIHQYNGIKSTDDKSDAFFLAELLRMKALPGCWICPREDRPIRDLLRTRMMLIEKRTAFKNSLSSMIARQTGTQMRCGVILGYDRSQIDDFVEDKDIAFRISQLRIQIASLTGSIDIIEKRSEKRLKLKPEYQGLLTVPGIGKIIAMTIMVETGDIKRFAKSGDYTSYCRCVDSHRTSNGKNKGQNNKRNGSRYLAWAFTEAAVSAKRYCEEADRYWQRKNSKSGSSVLAYKSLAAKMTKACYYIMRDNSVFSEKKLFGV